MKIILHVPRKSEAELHPDLKQDISVTPRFYHRQGLVPVFYFTTVDAKGNEEKHVLTINAGNKKMHINKLVEVVPACDEDKKSINHANNGRSTSDTSAED